MSREDDPDPDDDPGRSRKTLAATLVVAALLLGGWWLMSELQRHNEVQNCIASGRRDCVPIAPEAGR